MATAATFAAAVIAILTAEGISATGPHTSTVLGRSPENVARECGIISDMVFTAMRKRDTRLEWESYEIAVGDASLGVILVPYDPRAHDPVADIGVVYSLA